MEKFVLFAIKGIILKFAAYVLLKRYLKLKRTNLRNTPIRATMNFFIETVTIQDSAYINQIKNDWSIIPPSNGIPVSYKIDTGAQCKKV